MWLQSAAVQSIRQQRQELSQVVWLTNKNASFRSPGSRPKSPPRPPHRLNRNGLYNNHNSNYHNNHNHQVIVMPVVKVVVSGGYVGWTGTQDKRGTLVVLPLKYPLRDFFFKRLSFDVPLSQYASLFQNASFVSHLRRLSHDYSACSLDRSNHSHTIVIIFTFQRNSLSEFRFTTSVWLMKIPPHPPHLPYVPLLEHCLKS